MTEMRYFVISSISAFPSMVSSPGLSMDLKPCDFSLALNYASFQAHALTLLRIKSLRSLGAFVATSENTPETRMARISILSLILTNHPSSSLRGDFLFQKLVDVRLLEGNYVSQNSTEATANNGRISRLQEELRGLHGEFRF